MRFMYMQCEPWINVKKNYSHQQYCFFINHPFVNSKLNDSASLKRWLKMKIACTRAHARTHARTHNKLITINLTIMPEKGDIIMLKFDENMKITLCQSKGNSKKNIYICYNIYYLKK